MNPTNQPPIPQQQPQASPGMPPVGPQALPSQQPVQQTPQPMQQVPMPPPAEVPPTPPQPPMEPLSAHQQSPEVIVSPPAQPYPPTQFANETNEQKIEHIANAAKASQEVLYEAHSIFPFQLFPDSITVDREKANIVKRAFFKVGEAISIQIDDIMNVSANVGPFLGSLKITLRFVNQDPIEIHYLSRNDALKLKSILQGYTIARQNGIDYASMDKKELTSVLLRLGSGQAGATSM